jgi:hypothetical protein
MELKTETFGDNRTNDVIWANYHNAYADLRHPKHFACFVWMFLLPLDEGMARRILWSAEKFVASIRRRGIEIPSVESVAGMPWVRLLVAAPGLPQLNSVRADGAPTADDGGRKQLPAVADGCERR